MVARISVSLEMLQFRGAGGGEFIPNQNTDTKWKFPIKGNVPGKINPFWPHSGFPAYDIALEMNFKVEVHFETQSCFKMKNQNVSRRMASEPLPFDCFAHAKGH